MSKTRKMGDRNELVCKHCKVACWDLENPCSDGKGEGIGDSECISPNSLDDTGAFFYRLLILDDIKQRKKEEEDPLTQVHILRNEERKDGKTFKPRRSRPVSPGARPDARPVSSSCYRCGGSVYLAEARMTMGKTFHDICFTCRTCHRFLDAMNVTDGPDGDAYCYNCYKHRFLTDVNRPLGASKTNTIMAEDGDVDRCPRCCGKVFQAEKALSSHGVYHRACFRCAEEECGKQLDSTSYCDSDTGKIFCRTCYNKVHGQHGFGYGSTPTLFSSPDVIPIPRNLNSESREKSSSTFKPTSTSSKCEKCCKPVFALERMFVGQKVWHKACLSCHTCSRMLDASLLNEVRGGEEVYCPKCYKNTFKPSNHQ